MVLEIKNIKVKVEYINSSQFKGQICSRVDYSRIIYYAATRLNGGVFSTFNQADSFMERLGYHKQTFHG